MATVYLRTEAEAIEDGLLCAEACEHIDCAAYRREAVIPCRYCDEIAAGHSVFYEDGQPVHSACVTASIR